MPGLQPSRRRDVTGQRFGRLVALFDVGIAKRRHWCCRCDCGTERIVPVDALTSGKTRSCGCLKAEIISAGAHMTHGHAPVRGPQSPTYQSWRGMLARCNQPSSQAFKNYGARGVTVCQRWREFKNFLADMGERPTGLTLDRINNDGIYEPSNCRWATRAQQTANRRCSRKVA